jgi:hypothetical protein
MDRMKWTDSHDLPSAIAMCCATMSSGVWGEVLKYGEKKEINEILWL